MKAFIAGIIIISLILSLAFYVFTRHASTVTVSDTEKMNIKLNQLLAKGRNCNDTQKP